MIEKERGIKADVNFTKDMRNTPFWWILIGSMILIDIYCFQAVKVISQPGNPRIRTAIAIIYWVISAAAIITLIILPYLHFEHQAKLFRTTIFAIIAGLFFAKIVASVFFLIDDIRRGVQWIASRFFTNNSNVTHYSDDERISRSAFLSWTGMIFGGGLFASLMYGFGNKYRYQLKKVSLSFPNLPESFRGLKVIHLSDIHSGSFTDKEAVMKGVQKVLDQQPDLILFTGDLVNDIADEMKEYTDIFSKLKAPMGVYAVLGNHDYGDYVKWDSPSKKEENLGKLKDVIGQMGWRLLINEHVALERNGEKIAIVGIENWSAKARFPKYGDMKKAYEGVAQYPFKILMSHDPSHWEGEVLRKYRDIDLTLSGHTHGMQFGVEIPGLKWSPVQYVYKQWAGLYEKEQQKLYVNRGFGFIGYPGRVGILPEITLIELS